MTGRSRASRGKIRAGGSDANQNIIGPKVHSAHGSGLGGRGDGVQRIRNRLRRPHRTVGLGEQLRWPEQFKLLPQHPIPVQLVARHRIQREYEHGHSPDDHQLSRLLRRRYKPGSSLHRPPAIETIWSGDSWVYSNSDAYRFGQLSAFGGQQFDSYDITLWMYAVIDYPANDWVVVHTRFGENDGGDVSGSCHSASYLYLDPPN